MFEAAQQIYFIIHLSCMCNLIKGSPGRKAEGGQSRPGSSKRATECSGCLVVMVVVSMTIIEYSKG